MRTALIAAQVIPLTLLATPVFAQGGRASVRGTITAQSRPLAGVLVMRLGSGDSTRSDSLGRYVLPGLASGRHIFEVRKRGYSPLEMEITFPDDTVTIQADIPMDVSTGDPTLTAKLDQVGFNERRRNARERDRVTFLAPEDIEARDAVRVSQLFLGVRDITVRYESTSSGSISVVYGADGRCPMYVWVDDQLVDNVFPPASSASGSAPTSFGNARGNRSAVSTGRYTGLDDLLNITRIGAIEIYPRPSNVPQRFQRGSQIVTSTGRDIDTRSAECGAIVIWTH